MKKECIFIFFVVLTNCLGLNKTSMLTVISNGKTLCLCFQYLWYM